MTFMTNPTPTSVSSEFAHHLRTALPYLARFRNSLVVVLMDGTLLDSPDSHALEDLALLSQSGLRMLIVLDCAPLVGVELTSHGESRLNEAEQLLPEQELLPKLERICAHAHSRLMMRLATSGTQILPVTGPFVQAERLSSAASGVETCNGKVREICAEQLAPILETGGPVLLPTLAHGEKGRLWWLEAEEVALEAAVRTRAQKLILLQSTVLHWQGDTSTQETKALTANEVRRGMAAHPDWPAVQQRRVLAMAQACERGVERAQWVDGTQDGSLLQELLTSEGAGWMVTDRDYQRVRSARLSDAAEILRILQPEFQQAAVVQRTAECVQQHIERFLVGCVDEEVVGCCELVDYGSESVELAGLAVDEAHRNRGFGRLLVEAGVAQATRQGHSRMFALTTGSAHVFQYCGFQPATPEQLPEAKRQDYDFQGSGVYLLQLR